ncbi:ATP-binding cassette domain-containing protein [Pseudomonas serboccidentalis]|uniref:ATP-binding cassette domain-containing protein n=1 Tax=Pseudomonas serboccidentalis TaxID=2964670 RepID=A0ABY7ZGI9_9PSED|nr:ABC-F family ATP-binding cassette domain-containing protein [Pseudomonas serboccidentalis]WDR38042.1 ATP-binding cassette domain-containing protein [Pseudomonas serboccidentalis]
MTHVSRTPALVSLNQTAFRFANGETIFNDLNLQFDHLHTAIVGRNGVGKSVLARLIAGRLQPTAGSVTCAVTVAYVAQTFIVEPGQTVADATGTAAALRALQRLQRGEASEEDFDTLGERWDLPERLRQWLNDAGLPDIVPSDLTQSLSGGQQARLALIGAFLSPARLLVLDEPTNHLDAAGRRWLMSELQRWRGGLIVVSHDRQLLERMQRIVELTPSGATVFGGNFSTYQQQRQIHQAAAQATLDQSRTERRREQQRLKSEHDTIQRHAARSLRNAKTANVSGFERASLKGAARQIMGHVRHGHQQRKSELDARVRDAYAKVLPDDAVMMNLPGSAVPTSRNVCTLIDVRLPWLRTQAFNLTLSGPVRVAVNGPNGCGKSTLLQLLAGELRPVSGECTTHVPVAYLDQQLKLLDDHLSVIDQLIALQSPLSESELRSHLAHLQLDAQRVTRPSASLSGGERLKAALAVALWRQTPAQLLLLDEPSNHLDLASVQAFEQALQTFPGAIVAVSHDPDFLQALKPTHRLDWHHGDWRLQPTN